MKEDKNDVPRHICWHGIDQIMEEHQPESTMQLIWLQNAKHVSQMCNRQNSCKRKVVYAAAAMGFKKHQKREVSDVSFPNSDTPLPTFIEIYIELVTNVSACFYRV